VLRTDQALDKLQAQLGYRFKNEGLLELALSHRSYGKSNNERLEFLGDSIVNFVIAEALYARFTDAREGQLSRMRASLVKGVTLAEVARDLSLGDAMRLGSGELKSGGFRRESILADGLEAVIGAVFLDSGFETVQTLLRGLFASRLDALKPEDTRKDSKTRLQELLQSRQAELPVYEILEVLGEAHAQTFVVKCTVNGLEDVFSGRGPSRRLAEQKAAAKALKNLEGIQKS
tara:strand:+ start:5523 stop:6218 length:696 start_codon:yes stop_codon:yes gene_type:complete